MQNVVIITNNPTVCEKYEHVLYYEAPVEEILIKVRDMVHNGYELISHPLPASLRMMFSPYRSIIVGKKLEKIDPFSVEVIEDSLIKYRNHMDFRRIDTVNKDDYKLVDQLLLESSLQEAKAIS